MSARQTIRNDGQVIRYLLIFLVVLASVHLVNATITFTPGHLYATYPSTTRDIIEYTSTGTVLGSVTVSTSDPFDELHGIAFGPDGLLYAVKTQSGACGYAAVLALNSSGTIVGRYPIPGVCTSFVTDGKIAIDQPYIYAAVGDYLFRFTIGNPTSGVLIYSANQVEDVKILPSGNLFVGTAYYVQEITSEGTIVRTIVGNEWPYVDIRGIEYNPATNKLFVAELGVSDYPYSVLRVDASTGVIDRGLSFGYADDLVLTQEGTLFIGSVDNDRVPQIYTQDLNYVRTVGTASRAFVTQYETVTTNLATNVASFSATLNGSLNPNGLTATVYFQYGPTTSYGFTTAMQTQTGNTFRNISASISGLSASTTYHFRIVAHSSAGTSYGSDRTFATLSPTGPPVVTTNPATLIASFSATLNGSLDPHGLTTTVYFQYGPTTSYGFTTAMQTQTGNTFRNISASISGLSASTTYHFRIVAHSSAGTSYGSDRTFATLSPTGPPVVTTNPATLIASFSATLNGSLDPHGLTTTVYFQYGPTTSYGFTTAIQTQTGNTFRNISANISGLSASTVYHFRIVATNSAGTRYGGDRTFTTLTATGPPVVTTNPASNVASSSASLNGSLDPHGLTTTVYFQYGPTTSYGFTTAIQTQTGNTFRNISANISGLSPSTTYHFRIVATNSAGTSYGLDSAFATP